MAASGINLRGNTVMKIINETKTLEGDVILTDNATLYIYNSDFTFSMKKNYQYSIRLSGHSRLIVIGSNLSSNKYFNIEMDDNSTAIFNEVDEKVSSMWSMFSFEVNDFSNVSLTKSKVYKVNAYDFSFVNASKCRIYGVYLYDSAQFYGYNLVELRKVHTKGSSSALISALPSVTSLIRNVDIKLEGSSNVSISEMKIGGAATIALGGKIESYDNSRLTIIDSSISSITSLQDVLINSYDFSSISLGDVKVSGAVFKCFDNSSLGILNGSQLSGVRVYAYDNSTVNVRSDSMVDWLLEADDFSNVSVSNSEVILLRSVGLSKVSVSDSIVGSLQIRDFSKALFVNSTVKQVSINLISVNCTFSNFLNGLLKNWRLKVPGILFNLTLLNTRLEGGWSLMFYGSSNVTIYNSKLWYFAASDNSTVRFFNTTVYTESVVSGSANVYLEYNLTVHIVDLFGNPISGANVTLSYDGVPVWHGFSDENGMVNLALSKVVDGSEYFSPSSYVVTVEWNGYSESESVGEEQTEWLRSNFSSSITLPSPWWYWYAIYSGIILALCVVVAFILYFVVKKRRKLASST